jgi:hypothetical protein
MTPVVAAVASLLLAAPPHAGPCDSLAGPGLLRVDRERIGPFLTAATLAELRADCPGATETLGFGFETAWAAVDLSIGEVTILAGQNWLTKAIADDPSPDPTPDWSRAPSHFVLRGCGAELPGGVSSCGSWSDLAAAHGLEGEAYAEFGPVIVRLDSLPGFEILLAIPEDVLADLDLAGDLAGIPSDATIDEIVVVPAGAP